MRSRSTYLSPAAILSAWLLLLFLPGVLLAQEPENELREFIETLRAHPGAPRPSVGPAARADSSPRLTHLVAPTYPPEARAHNLGGSVTVQFTIDINGVPREVRVVKSTPPGVFDRAAIDAVTRWRYQPVLINGNPMEVTKQQSIHFDPGD
jgi:protein TonB